MQDCGVGVGQEGRTGQEVLKGMREKQKMNRLGPTFGFVVGPPHILQNYQEKKKVWLSLLLFLRRLHIQAPHLVLVFLCVLPPVNWSLLPCYSSCGSSTPCWMLSRT